MSVADRSNRIGLRALRRLAGTDALDRLGLRPAAERAINRASRNGFRGAAAASRTFRAVSKRARPVRPAGAGRRDAFDLTPEDDQQMMRDAMREFAAGELRPAAPDADAACAAPDELLAQSAELGLGTLGVPEELGGSASERSAVTGVLIAEALAHGDMGLAAAALAPGAVSTALALWGDADQQATYLPALTGDDAPAAALALLEARPAFDPFALETAARPADGGYVLSGVKSLVPRAASAELFVVAAQREGHGPGLFLVESGTAGVGVEAEPAMGVRAAATGSAGASRGRRSRERPARGGRPGRLRRGGAARAPGLVRAGGRHRAGRARLRDPLRQRAQGVRRADLQPPGRRVRGGGHRDRARGHATGHLARRQPRRPGARLRARGRARAGAVRVQGDGDRLRRRAATRAATAT